MRWFMVFTAVLLATACGTARDDPTAPQLSVLADPAPHADLVVDCGYLWCSFTDQSTPSDPDGSIDSCVYEIDGDMLYVCDVFYEWETPGERSVKFTVTDDLELVDDTSFTVSVEVSPITVESEHQRSKGRHSILLRWKGAAGAEVKIVRTGGDPTQYENPKVWPSEPNDDTEGVWNELLDELEGKCVSFTYTVYELIEPDPHYSWPTHRVSCESGGGKKGKGPKS